MRRQRAAWLLVFAIASIAGCAHPTRATGPTDPQTGPWSGRLALQVEDNASQSFSAGFELTGNAQAGELALNSPLGGTVALLSWTPGSALLKANGQTRQFESVDALVAHATGSAIPVAVLFDWLAGTNTPVAGWEADLSQLAQGRLRAKRTAPPPAADLRVAFER